MNSRNFFLHNSIKNFEFNSLSLLRLLMPYSKIVFEKYGNPSEVLKMISVNPIPTPGPLEVVIKVKSSPINPSVLYFISGHYLKKASSFPATPGNDAAGVVDSIGSGVKKFKPGDRVIPLSIKKRIGTWTEYMVVDESSILPHLIPESISFSIASQFVVNGLTAISFFDPGVNNGCGVGDWFLHASASSSLGHIFVQLANHYNINLINVVRREEQMSELKKSVGAKHVIVFDGSKENEFIERVNKITNGKGVNVVFDPISGTIANVFMKVLVPRGVLVEYGMLSGEPLAIDFSLLLSKQLQVRGYWLEKWIQENLSRLDKYSEELFNLLGSKKITFDKPIEYDFKDYMDAIKASTAKGKNGKVILTMD